MPIFRRFQCILVPSGENMVISFPTVTGKTYNLWRSDDLITPFTDTGIPAIPSDGSVKQFSAPAPAPIVPKYFYRVQVSQ